MGQYRRLRLAGGAVAQVLSDGVRIFGRQVAVDLGRQQQSSVLAGHGSPSSKPQPNSCSRVRSRCRAAANRDFSVLAGTPRTRAISSKLIPWSCRRASTSRCRGGSSATAHATAPASSRRSHESSARPGHCSTASGPGTWRPRRAASRATFRAIWNNHVENRPDSRYRGAARRTRRNTSWHKSGTRSALPAMRGRNRATGCCQRSTRAAKAAASAPPAAASVPRPVGPSTHLRRVPRHPDSGHQCNAPRRRIDEPGWDYVTPRPGGFAEGSALRRSQKHALRKASGSRRNNRRCKLPTLSSETIAESPLSQHHEPHL